MLDKNDPGYGNTYVGLAEAMTIFAQYSDEAYGVEGHHDEILAGPGLPGKVDQKDLDRLKQLGWSVDTDSDCFIKHT